MAKKVFNMQGGRHSAAALSAFVNAMFGSSIANGLDVQPTGSAGLNVLVKVGNGNIDTGSGFGRLIQVDADETVALNPASASNPRNDLIVAYIDNSVTPTTAVTDNTNNILKFVAVAGTPASVPTDPSASTIQSVIGAGNPYMVLGRVRVNTSATSIVIGNITDLRQVIAPPFNGTMIADNSISNTKLTSNSVSNAKVQDGAISQSKIDFSTGVWWEEIGRAVLSSNDTVINVPSIPSKKYIKVLISIPGTTNSIVPRIRFNGDTGNNYSARRSENGAADAVSPSTNGIPFHAAQWINSYFYEVLIFNFSTRVKPVTFKNTLGQTAASNAPMRVDGSGTWHNNTALINSIQVATDTNQFLAGAEVVVLGHD